jgi:hypothetical protein
LANKINIYRIQAGIFVSLFCFALASCGEKDKTVAKVGDIELKESEAVVLMEHYDLDINKESEYKAFLKEWCNQEVYKQELKQNHPEQYELVRLRADGFQSELAKYYLEEISLKKKLDTIVSKKEMEDFYNEHKEEFILHDYIVKALYLKIPKSVDFKEKKIHQKFMLKNDKDLNEINSYSKLYAENFYFNDSSWIYFTELSEDIPLTKYNVDNIVLNRTKTYFSDEDHTYFLNIIDYKLKDEAPPLDFLRDQIREIIVTKRLQQLKDKNGPKLLKEIKSKYEITINP